MTDAPTLADRIIETLRDHHDALVMLIPNLPDEQLEAPSGASEWTIAQVLSHLGSGAEIGRKPIAVAAGEEVSAEDNQAIWARWDGSSPVEQAAGFVEHDGALLETLEGLSAEQRASLTVDLGFFPEPVPLVVPLGMRLNEVANHSWDVRVGLDPDAEVDGESAELLLELFAGPLSFMLGFSAKPELLEDDVRLAVPGGGLTVTDAVTVSSAAVVADPTATLTGPQGAVVRLLSGRLTPERSEGVEVEGNVGLDDLRQVFPGY